MTTEGYRKIVLKSEPDRYGFSHVLAQRLGLPGPRRSYCAWVHGWVWWQALAPEELGYGGAPKDVTIVCGNAQQGAMLSRHGFRDVVVGGVPFCYVPEVKARREEGSLLVFLPHSLDYYQLKLSTPQYLDYLASIRNDFSRIDVCIYSHDYDEGTQRKECEERGLNPLRGACPDDAEALVKQRRRLEQYEYVTTPSLGSHVLYAAYCGCKISMTPPLFSYREEHFKHDLYVQKYPLLARRHEDVNSEAYIRETFPWLIVDHPAQGGSRDEWAAEQIGAAHRLDDETLRRALGWDVAGRIKGPLLGTRRRLGRLFS